MAETWIGACSFSFMMFSESIWGLQSVKISFKKTAFVCRVANTVSNTYYVFKNLTSLEKIICGILDFVTKSVLCFVGSKCLTLLVEIHPVNNVKVLKAVDSCIWVQVSEYILSH